MIKYKKMSLFDAPKGSILAHGCNAMGVWGSGIAVEFKKRFPKTFEDYNKGCLQYIEWGWTLCGDHYLSYTENDHKILCLITSKDYGKNKDSVSDIIIQTTLALQDFCVENNYLLNTAIYSNKFNSGLFGVPWEETEKILNYFVKNYDLDWTICDPNL